MLYEYQCIECGRVIELTRSVLDRRKPVACECGSDMNLVPSLSAFTLKGSGWTPKGFEPTTPTQPKRRTAGYDMTGSRHDD